RDRAPDFRVRAFGELVGLLWKEGRYSAAVRLEQFWNRLITSHGLHLFCAYPIDIFGPEFQSAGLDALLCAHSHVLPGGRDEDLETAIDRALRERLGATIAGLKIPLEDICRPFHTAIPKAEATVLWLRNNVPSYADEILARARLYYHASPRRIELAG